MDAVARRYLTDLVVAARAVLGADLVGAYAAGSIGLGAYEPGRSDIDVALVCADALDDGRKHDLVARLRHEALPCPARGLELVVYRREVAASGTPEPGFEVELNTGAGMPFRATYAPADRPAADGRFWYGLDRSILHQTGLALTGPPAAEAFADLSPADLREQLVAALTWWIAQPGPGTGDAVLGACRSLVKVRYGTWLSKADAGRRLLDAGYPSADVIRRAVEARRGGPAPGGPEARAFQQRIIDELS